MRMHRRAADRIEDEIAQWQLTRSDIGLGCPQPVSAFIATQISRLRFEASMLNRPKVDGSRTDDKRANGRS